MCREGRQLGASGKGGQSLKVDKYHSSQTEPFVGWVAHGDLLTTGEKALASSH